MKEKASLNKWQLQMIAIVAMLIDHVAWAFVPFHSPLGQVMHVIGRLTIPIMCFFIAEGFRRTHHLRIYIGRVTSFAVISIVPFYFFFGEEYGYRQNILFDHVISLMLLFVLEHEKLSKWQKVLFAVLLFLISILIGGWPLAPQFFTLAFYYGKTFREKAKWVILTTFLAVLTVGLFAAINQKLHFASYDWTLFDRAYLLGFILALPLLARYNGEKGKAVFGKGFFYCFYPAHLLILTLIMRIMDGSLDNHALYLLFHIACLLLVLIMLVAVVQAKVASKMQTALVMFLAFMSFYFVGFIIEIFATSVETLYMAAAVEYFGELLMLVAFQLFASECGRIIFPMFMYIAQVLSALALTYSILISERTGFFYNKVSIVMFDGYTKGVFDHGLGYYLSVGYIIVVVVGILFIMINSLLKGSEIEKKRMGLIFGALMFIWIPYAIMLTGITKGYEIPGLGVVGVAFFLTRCLYKYGTLDSVAIASENALGKAGEGIVILDDRKVVTFTNALSESILGGEAPVNSHADKNATLTDILKHKITEIRWDNKIFEVKTEELRHASLLQGYMIWFLDVTKHRALLDEAENMAFHDALTGLYNRRQFEKLVNRELEDKRCGTLVISDMDNFKAVNDTFGHKRGDQVLTDYADILMTYSEEELYPCRIGGDEFMFYIRDVAEREKVEAYVRQIMDRFRAKFEGETVKCTLSIGIVMNSDREHLLDFVTMYREADKKLYIAKEKGKDTFIL